MSDTPALPSNCCEQTTTTVVYNNRGKMTTACPAYRFREGGQFGFEIVDERVETVFGHVGVFGVVADDFGDFRGEIL